MRYFYFDSWREIVEVGCVVLTGFERLSFASWTRRIEHVLVYTWQTSRRRNVWFLLIVLSIYRPVSIFIRMEIGNLSEVPRFWILNSSTRKFGSQMLKVEEPCTERKDFKYSSFWYFQEETWTIRCQILFLANICERCLEEFSITYATQISSSKRWNRNQVGRHWFFRLSQRLFFSTFKWKAITRRK